MYATCIWVTRGAEPQLLMTRAFSSAVPLEEVNNFQIASQAQKAREVVTDLLEYTACH